MAAAMVIGMGVNLAAAGLADADPDPGSPDAGTQLSDSQVAQERAELDKTAWDIGSTRALTAAEQQLVESKEAEASEKAASAPASAGIAKDQHAQTTTYYCGPAAVQEALGQRSIGGVQAKLASAMRTTGDGTAWSGVNANVAYTTGHPVPDVLNDRIESHGQSFTYIATAMPDPPTAAQITSFESRVKTNVYYAKTPVLGDAYEVPKGPHLYQHPDITIFHWFDIRGYSNSGATTEYEDSVHGASTISWSGNVPAYSSLPSSMIAHIVGGRGYVW